MTSEAPNIEEDFTIMNVSDEPCLQQPTAITEQYDAVNNVSENKRTLEIEYEGISREIVLKKILHARYRITGIIFSDGVNLRNICIQGRKCAIPSSSAPLVYDADKYMFKGAGNSIYITFKGTADITATYVIAPEIMRERKVVGFYAKTIGKWIIDRVQRPLDSRADDLEIIFKPIPADYEGELRLVVVDEDKEMDLSVVSGRKSIKIGADYGFSMKSLLEIRYSADLRKFFDEYKYVVHENN